MIGIQERDERLERIASLIDMALGDAMRLERDDNYSRPGVISPTPAENLLVVRAIGVAADVVQGALAGSHFVPEDMHPPGPSYAERMGTPSGSRGAS